jgi:serine/threonine protein kinase
VRRSWFVVRRAAFEARRTTNDEPARRTSNHERRTVSTAIIHTVVSFAPGARLGAYEILSPLGAGGMGEVYRARDTRLNRDIAIKVLLAEVAGDPDRLMLPTRHFFSECLSSIMRRTTAP